MKQNWDWRTIQIFLERDLTSKGELQISEVSIHADGPSVVKCTCSNFKDLEICSHVNYVIRKMEKNNGSFGLLVPEHIPDEFAFAAFTDAESSRNFILRYGKIEVL